MKNLLMKKYSFKFNPLIFIRLEYQQKGKIKILVNQIIENYYQPGGMIIRAMAAKLFAGERITPHTDKHPSFHIAHRIHIPITTNYQVRFTLAGRPFHLELGKVYEVNNRCYKNR